ncbi:MAG: O-antigen ligase [Cyanobacteria bacterium J06648_16]
MLATPPVSPSLRSQSRLSVFALGESLFCIYSVLFFTGGMETVLGSPTLFSLMRYSVLMGSGLLLAMRWRNSLAVIRQGRLMWLLLLFMCFSIFWSLYPEATYLSIKGQIVPYTCFCVYFASRFNIRQQLRLTGIALAIVALLSLFYAVAIPSVGVHVSPINGEVAWQGIYAEKNAFSGMGTITLLVYFVLSLYNTHRFEQRLARIGVVATIGLILLSSSKTGLIVFLVLLLCIMAFQRYRWQGKRTVLVSDILVFLLLFVGGLIITYWFDITAALGKDPTMSSRTTIWAGTMEQIWQRPWIGYGLEAFWQDGNPQAVEVGRVIHRSFVPAHAHNGLIDIWLDIGIVGLIIFFAGYLSTAVLAFKRAYRASQPEDFWPLAMVLLMLFYNITETWSFKQGNFFWVIYVTTFLSVRVWPRRSPD